MSGDGMEWENRKMRRLITSEMVVTAVGGIISTSGTIAKPAAAYLNAQIAGPVGELVTALESMVGAFHEDDVIHNRDAEIILKAKAALKRFEEMNGVER